MQFSRRDRDLAARVLDVVDFYGTTQIHGAFRQALQCLQGWNTNENNRAGNWRFAPMSGSAGESGDMMLYQFRLANNLTAKKYNNLFASRSDLFRQPMLPPDDPLYLGENDTVVLVDDFSGTGQQVCDAWNDPQTSFGALLAGVGRVFLVLVAGSHEAQVRISRETSLTPMFVHTLSQADDVFSENCARFQDKEKERLLHYCRRASKSTPKGFGDCGLVVVFQHRCPNNSIPILHADNPRWNSLFPRHAD